MAFTVVTTAAPAAAAAEPHEFLANADVYCGHQFILPCEIAADLSRRHVITFAYYPEPRITTFDQNQELNEIYLKYDSEVTATATIVGLPVRERNGDRGMVMLPDGNESFLRRPPHPPPLISSERRSYEPKRIFFSINGGCKEHGPIVRMPMEIDNFGNVFLRGVLPRQRDLYLMRHNNDEPLSIGQQTAIALLRDIEKLPTVVQRCSHILASENIRAEDVPRAPTAATPEKHSAESSGSESGDSESSGSESSGSESGDSESSGSESGEWSYAKQCPSHAYNLVAASQSPCVLLTEPALKKKCHQISSHVCDKCYSRNIECYCVNSLCTARECCEIADPNAHHFCELLAAHFDKFLRRIEESR